MYIYIKLCTICIRSTIKPVFPCGPKSRWQTLAPNEISRGISCSAVLKMRKMWHSK